MRITWACSNCTRTAITGPEVCRIAHLHGKEEIELIPYKKPMKPRGEVTTKKLHKEVWDLFSEWVRRSEADENGYCRCVTCNDVRRWQDGDAGHWKHGTSFFIPEIVHFQCKVCNSYGAGMAVEYTAWMNEHYKPNEIAKFLNQVKYLRKKLSIWELLQYKTLYQRKLAELPK
jgi:hypothetical protein